MTANSDEENVSQQKFALSVIQSSSLSELMVIQNWAEQLLAIKADTSLSLLGKIRKSIGVTANYKVLLPFLKNCARQLKKSGWDDRPKSWRMGLAGAAVGLTFFSGQSAGIAALGGAIGVPLWVVLGAGASFMNLLIQEIKKRNIQVIEAEYTEVKNDTATF